MSPAPHPTAALVIIGHGSTLNPDSSAPTYHHADEIRRRGLFAEVACTFWKEEPGMRDVYAMVQSREIYLVPNFISEGYFCQQVLPRELQVTAPITQLGDRTLYYCDPVGIHPNMTRLILQRADEVAPGVPRDQTCLIIVGHGTSLNENSTKAIKDQVQLIREGGYGFAEVLDAYMEEAPFIADWAKVSHVENVVVVPFFIADGLHSYQDIPVMLGMEAEVGAAASQREVFRHNPHHLQGRTLYYSSAIGTEALMADVVLDQVAAFDQRHSITPVASAPDESPANPIAAWLTEHLAQHDPLYIGQVAIIPNASSYRLLHRDDLTNSSALTQHRGSIAARDIAFTDEHNAFRPLKTAPTLRRGWELHLDTLADLILALDHLYPAALGMAMHHQRGSLESVPLRTTLARQTGMYRRTNTILDDQAMSMVGKVCATATKCQRRILWPLTPDQPLTDAAAEKATVQHASNEIPLLCCEACTHIVGEARKIAKANFEASK